MSAGCKAVSSCCITDIYKDMNIKAEKIRYISLTFEGLVRGNHLRSSKVQFLKTNNIVVPCCIHFIPLKIEQILEGKDKFKVRGGRYIVVSP